MRLFDSTVPAVVLGGLVSSDDWRGVAPARSVGVLPAANVGVGVSVFGSRRGVSAGSLGVEG